MELLGIVIFFIIFYLITHIGEYKFNNYMPPEGQRIDYNKQSLDRVQNHLTNEQVKRNTVNGKYNVRSFLYNKYKEFQERRLRKKYLSVK